MQQGRGGMGSHKHGISGYPGPNARNKAERCREANAEAAARRRRHIPLDHDSVIEAVETFRPDHKGGTDG